MVWPAPQLVTRPRIDPSIASASVITWMLLMVITPSVPVACWVIVNEKAVVPTAAELVSRPEAELVLMTGVSAVVPVFRKMSWRAWNATPMLERGRIVTVMVSPALNWPACVSVMVRLPRSEFAEPLEPGAGRGGGRPGADVGRRLGRAGDEGPWNAQARTIVGAGRQNDTGRVRAAKLDRGGDGRLRPDLPLDARQAGRTER